MIITKTPFRISFFGGGTDYPQWFNKHGGATIATTINKYCYVIAHESKLETILDLPSGAGLGTSSAYVVGVLRALTKLTQQEIAGYAATWESKLLEQNIGRQDQWICALGGFRLLRFGASAIDSVTLNGNAIKDYLMLFDTGQYRYAGQIVSSQLKRMAENETTLYRIKDLTEIAEVHLDKPIEFGRLLDEEWQLKKSLSADISNSFIDNGYETAKAMGAIGGKLLGAGGGGFFLLLAEPEKHKGIISALRNWQHVQFEFETEGTRIIYEG